MTVAIACPGASPQCFMVPAGNLDDLGNTHCVAKRKPMPHVIGGQTKIHRSSPTIDIHEPPKLMANPNISKVQLLANEFPRIWLFLKMYGRVPPILIQFIIYL